MTRNEVNLIRSLIYADRERVKHETQNDYNLRGDRHTTDGYIEYGRRVGIDPRTVNSLESLGLVETTTNENNQNIVRLKENLW